MTAAAVIPIAARSTPPSGHKRGAKKKRCAPRRKADAETMAILIRLANHLILKDRFSYQDAMTLFQAAVLNTSLLANGDSKTRAAEALGITREHMSKISERAKLVKRAGPTQAACGNAESRRR